MSEIRILIVEDEPVIAAEIAACLDQLDYCVSGKAYTLPAALDQLKNNPPDAVLLDINLGEGQEGIEIAGRINREHHLPFLFLTSYAVRATLEAAKRTGPAGYIVKPFTEKDLLAGIEIALYNYAQLQNARRPDLDRATLDRRLLSPLTDREFELLQLLREGYTNRQMAEKSFVSVNTVKTHLKNLYLKLDARTRTEAIRRAQLLTSNF